MEELPQISESMRPTYELLLTEIASHLEFFEESCSRCSALTNSAALEDTLEELSTKLAHRFHVIKGGSGFLQLKAIQLASKEAEDLFKNGIDASLRTEDILAKLQQSVEVLRKEEQALRQLLEGTKS